MSVAPLRRTLVLVPILCGACAAPLRAQELPADAPELLTDTVGDRAEASVHARLRISSHAADVAMAGFGLGVLGLFGGYYYSFGSCYAQAQCDWKPLYAAQTAGVALGAHLANRGRGNLIVDLAASAVLTGAVWAITDAASESLGGSGWFFAGAAALGAQAAAVAAIELHTARLREVEP